MRDFHCVTHDVRTQQLKHLLVEGKLSGTYEELLYATLFKSPDQPLLPGKPVTPLETRIYLVGRFEIPSFFFVTRANVILYSVVLQRKRLICDWKNEALLSVLQLRLIVIRRKKKTRLQVNMNPKANPG